MAVPLPVSPLNSGLFGAHTISAGEAQVAQAPEA